MLTMSSKAIVQENKNLSASASVEKEANKKAILENPYEQLNNLEYGFSKIKVYDDNNSDNRFSSSSIRIQPKLTINQPGDKYEKEAEVMANKIMRMPDPLLNQGGFSKPGIPVIQRNCAHCEAEEKEQQIQRKESHSIMPQAGSHLISYVNNLNSSGFPLSRQTRNFFEPRFGFDFSKVRIHTDNEAAQSAKSIHAVAYTIGNNIVFKDNQFAPDTYFGKQLLAHELTHVIQQSPYTRSKASNFLSLHTYPEIQRLTFDAIASIEERQHIQVLPVLLPPNSTILNLINSYFAANVQPATLPPQIRVEFDSNIPLPIRAGLIGAAAELVFRSRPPILPLGTSTTIEITALGRNFRLTNFMHRQNAQSSQQVVVIEGVSPPSTQPSIAQQSNAWPPPSGNNGSNNPHHFHIVGFSRNERSDLRQALTQVPDAALVDGITFRRARRHPDGSDTSGLYNPQTNTITIFDSAWINSSYGAVRQITETIVHEIGHAADQAPIQQAFRVNNRSRHTTADEQALLNTRSLSGTHLQSSGNNSPVIEADVPSDMSGDFREAAQRDNIGLTSGVTRSGRRATLSGGITDYADESWREYFAESFSLYFLDPEILRSLRPNVFCYFEGRYHRYSNNRNPRAPGCTTDGESRPTAAQVNH